MSTATAIAPHIEYEVIEETKHQVVVIAFLSCDITSPDRAYELGNQLQSLIKHEANQYFVVDCAKVRSLGSTAFSEILSFVRKARPVWVCNLDHSLRIGAALVGLESCVRFAADRRAAIREADRAAHWDQEDTADYPQVMR